ncbi:MAG: hypothetical protein K8M05_36035 [Deltaproteobacteria bacterium]|nr:hypothetical protein [Kofleriaceae bacterium]
MVRHVHVVLVLVLGLVLALGPAACKKKGEAIDPLVKETMDKLTEVRDKGCACANLECATKVQNELASWYLANAKRLEPLTKKATKQQNEAGQKLSTELEACVQKLQAAAKSAEP